MRYVVMVMLVLSSVSAIFQLWQLALVFSIQAVAYGVLALTIKEGK